MLPIKVLPAENLLKLALCGCLLLAGCCVSAAQQNQSGQASTQTQSSPGVAAGGKGAMIGKGTNATPADGHKYDVPIPESWKPHPVSPAKGVIRKSRAYWSAFPADIARQVFDGDFGSHTDSFQRFRVFFTTYVELFAQRCPQSFQGPHETVTVTEVTVQKNGYGNEVSRREGESSTVEVESRLAPYYRKYGNSMNDSLQGLGNAIRVTTGRSGEIFDPAADASKFLRTEGCRSAAMRQMDENLYRAASGNHSLQWAGESVPGAAAESDKSIPPDRFTNLANACVTDARSKPRTYDSHDVDWCECVYMRLRPSMSSAEEDRYANDYGSFEKALTQPNNPLYPQLSRASANCQQR